MKIITNKYLRLTLLMLGATLITAGCSISFSDRDVNTTAGVFKSLDRTETWAERNLFLHSGGAASMADVNVLNMQFDPQDFDAIYLNTENSGVLYSYDAGSSWQQAKGLGQSKVESLAVDPKNKCVIYATLANTIVRSVDCSRSYQEMFIDTRSEKSITALAIDSFNNLVVYAGNNSGDIIKSSNGGSTWQVIHRLNQPIKKIVIDSTDTRTVYVATQGAGIFKTTNAGGDWSDVNDGLKPYSAAFEFKDLILDPTKSNSLFHVSKHGILKTNDGGGTWEALTLITPPASVDIFSAVVSPQDNDEIYYATASTFYRTVDGGQNWITTRLPSASRPATLLVDPRDPNVVYMAMFGAAQQ